MLQSYRLGDRGDAVTEIRLRLASAGLLPEAPNGPADDYDAHVDRAVRAFQQRRGLRVDGIVGPQTFRALDETRWRLGDRLLHYRVTHPYSGDDVAALQHRLLELGFDGGRCDGIFGAETERALREFQRNVGLPADGTFGPTTIRAMQQLRRSVVGGRPAALRDFEALHRAGRTLTGKTVIVDPGHGGADDGWVVGDLREQDIVFDIAARLEGRLAAAGAHAFRTRSVDGNPSEADRAAFANAAEGDLYVSLHLDGSPYPAAQGAASFFYGSAAAGEPHSSTGERLAELVQHEVVARTDLVDCRTHGRSWELLRLTRMPMVWVELGYLTNDHDAARLAEPGFRDTIAESLHAAVARLYVPAEEDPGTGQLRLPA
ncbi:MAG TPA: N-acetylmuramoyl-L-alanine amidase [Mycobacteriales bacterium]|nr:N-acetylmuramoyl-L-alanine amidase [Mycobacteriales bacterium]